MVDTIPFSIDTTQTRLPKRRKPSTLPKFSGGKLFLDIEAVPDYSRLDRFGLPELPPKYEVEELEDPEGFKTVNDAKSFLKAHSPSEKWLFAANRVEREGKNRQGVLEEINKCLGRMQARQDALSEQRKIMSVTPEYCRIVCISCAMDDQPVATVHLGEYDEAEMLAAVWLQISSANTIVTFNGNAYDLPVIFFRSMLNQVKSSKLISRARHHKDSLDLSLVVTGHPRKGFGLDHTCKILGLGPYMDTIDGSQVEKHWRDEDWQPIVDHCEADIHRLIDLHNFYSGFFC